MSTAYREVEKDTRCPKVVIAELIKANFNLITPVAINCSCPDCDNVDMDGPVISLKELEDV
jgi:hypothetical protein